MVGDYGHTWRRLLMGVSGAPGGRLSELDAVPGTRLLRVTRLLFALVSLVTLFAAPALADAEPVSLAPPIRVAGAGELSGVACSSATSCVAVGTNGFGGVVVPITNGIPGAATAVAGTRFLSGVACSRATSCVAVGRNATRWVVVPITNGIPGAATTVAGTAFLSGVACSSATSCVAVGDSASGVASDGVSKYVGVVVPITNGIPGAATTVAGTDRLLGVACSSATSCLAVGNNALGVASDGVFKYVGVAVPTTNGAPGAATTVAGTYLLEAVACAGATSCLAVGSDADMGGVAVPIANGTPGAAASAQTSLRLRGLVCSSATSCLAVGLGGNDLGGVAVPITDGAPGAVTPVAGAGDLYGVACSSATSCVAVGDNYFGENASGVVVPIINETPGVSSYRLTKNPFAVAGRSTPRSGTAARIKKHRRGTTFRYTLSEAATVKILIAQRRAGRRKHKRCVTPPRRLRHARKCTRIVVKGTLTRVSRLGANIVAFSGRIGSKALRPGTYQATLTATDATKNTSTAQTILFQIAKH